MSEFEELHEQITRLQTENAEKQLRLNEVGERLNAAVGPEYWGIRLLDAVEQVIKKLRYEVMAVKEKHHLTRDALEQIYEACMKADEAGELYETIDGDILDQAASALEKTK